MRLHRTPLLVPVLVVVAGLFALHAWLERDPEHAAPPKRARPVAAVVIGTPNDQPDPYAAVADVRAAFYAELERQDNERIAAELAAQAETAERARVEAARQAPSAPAPSGRDSGAHSDAFWRGVSGCEQSGRDDPRYGFLSIMDGSAAGKPWADQVAIANGIIARYGDSAWAASCVAAGYAASPTG